LNVVCFKASCACAAPTSFKVIKTNMARPFCVQCHVNVHPNTLNSGGVSDSDQMFSVGIQYTPTIEWRLNFFCQHNVNDWKFWSAEGLVIEKIQLPYHVEIENFHNCHKVWQPNISITIRFIAPKTNQVWVAQKFGLNSPKMLLM
jgi:hypothetical protein